MADTIKVHILKCGEVYVDPAVPFRDVSKNPVAYTGLFRSSKRKLWLPVYSYLIEHPKGNILLDTGWDKAVRKNPIKTESFLLWLASKPKLPTGSAVDEQLKKIGIRTNQLDYVFLTHMDVDHVNGIQLVKDAKVIMASSEEIHAASGSDVRYWEKQWKGIDLVPIPFEHSTDGIVGKTFDVFGDGSVKVIATPGHSAGSITILVKNNDSSILIAGDTGYAADSWRSKRLPGPVKDKDRMLQALNWVADLESNGTKI